MSDSKDGIEGDLFTYVGAEPRAQHYKLLANPSMIEFEEAVNRRWAVFGISCT